MNDDDFTKEYSDDIANLRKKLNELLPEENEMSLYSEDDFLFFENDDFSILNNNVIAPYNYNFKNTTEPFKPSTRPHRFAKKLNNSYIFLICNDILYLYDKKHNLYNTINSIELERIAIEEFGERTNSLTSYQFKEIFNWLFRIVPKCNVDDFNNASHNGINCLNGVVEFIDNIPSLRPHNEQDIFSYCVQANFLENKQDINMPTFENFCSTSLEENLSKKELLLQHIGYIFSDNTSAKKAICWIGQPHSGKSALQRLLTNLLSDKNVSNLDLPEMSNQFERARLHSQKLNVSPDASSKALNKVNHLKAAIGMDQITGAYKGKGSFSFFCRAKFLISSNTMISSNEYDPTNSFIDRLSVLRFNVSIPPEKQNKNLESDLLNEADSIFTTSLYAFSNLLNNFCTFPVPEDSALLLNSLKLDNPVSEFIANQLTESSDGYIFKFQILDALEKYCKENNFELPGWNDCKNMILTKFPKANYKKIHKRENPLDFNSPIINKIGFTGIYFANTKETNI